VDGDELLCAALHEALDRLIPRQNRYLRNGEHDLLVDHLAQARRRAADAEIHELGQGVELQIRQLDGEFAVHSEPALRFLSTEIRKSPSAFSVTGFARNTAPAASARSITPT